MSAWETVHEVCSPPLCLSAVTTQAWVKSFFCCKAARILCWEIRTEFCSPTGCLADPYLPEERHIASPSNCAHQRHKLPTPQSHADQCHRARLTLTSIWTRLDTKEKEKRIHVVTTTRIWTGICPNRRDICKGLLKEDIPAGGGHTCQKKAQIYLAKKHDKARLSLLFRNWR